MPSSRLVEILDQLEPLPFRGEAYRHIAARWHPLSGAGARSQGGRWNPPESFATLYLALTKDTAVEEFRRMARRSGRDPDEFLPRRLYRLRLELQAVVDLTDESSLPEPLKLLDLGSDDLSTTQAIGEAGQYLGWEGIRAPSAACEGDVLAVFMDRLEPDSLIEPVDFETWPSRSGSH
jgi:RES domain-containing protein